MIAKVENEKNEENIFALSTDSDFSKIFLKKDITLSEITKIRRWIKHSEREKKKFQKRMEDDFSKEIKDKKFISERMGIAWWVLDENGKAKKHLGKAGTELAHYFYAVCLQKAGDKEEAFEYLESLPARMSGSKNILCLKVKLLYALATIHKAEKMVEKLKKDFPDEIEAMISIGLFYEDSGSPQTAIDTYQKILERDPFNEEVLFYLGNLLDRFGFDNEALQCLEKCSELFPVKINAVINLGQMYYESGDIEKALFCFKRVLKSYPDHGLAQRYLHDISATENMYYDEKKAKKQAELNRILKIHVTDFELSVRSRNCLSRMNIKTLGDLIQKTESDLLSYKNFGETSLAEIKKMLASKGLYLGQAKDIQKQELKEKQKRKVSDITDSEVLGRNIEDLELSVRALRCLNRMEVRTFGQLIKLSESRLLRTRNFGQTSLNEIKQKLSAYSLSLANE